MASAFSRRGRLTVVGATSTMRFCRDYSGLSSCYCPKWGLSRQSALRAEIFQMRSWVKSRRIFRSQNQTAHLTKPKGTAQGRPFLGIMSCCICNHIEPAPILKEGRPISASYFVFFFFFAMMESSRFGSADQALEPLFENPGTDHILHYGTGAVSATCFS